MTNHDKTKDQLIAELKQTQLQYDTLKVLHEKETIEARQNELNLKAKASEIESQNFQLQQTIEELRITELHKQEERKKIQKELVNAQILMRAAFDQSPIPMVVASYPDFTFKIINKATEDFLLLNAADYLNLTPTDVEGWKWQEYTPDGEPIKTVHDLPLPLAMQGITTKNKEMIIERHDGSRVAELVSAAPIYGSDGELIAGIVVMIDITERKKAEQILKENTDKIATQNEEYLLLNEALNKSNQELIIAKEKAEESDRLKTAFLQNMGHEIRTPMNAIMGFSSLLTDNFDDKEQLERFSEIINQRCIDLLHIINDILDIAKIESGQLSVNIEECNINDLFLELATYFNEHQKQIGKQHIKLELDASPLLPEDRINTDSIKLKQIFINLIDNALKFTDEGTIHGGCKLDSNNNLVFYVSDTGIGIPFDKQKVVFERFAQLQQNPNKNIGGTGLGLSIVKGLVTLLGGKIWLESQPHKGSTFSFCIACKTYKTEQNESLKIEESQIFHFNNETVLIVEDDLYNAQYIKEVLTRKGLKILQAENGKKAIELSLSHPVDLILMDIRLPDMTGYEVTSHIFEHKPHLKIIAQTAYASTDEKQKALKAGCNDYISKPINRDLLLAMLNKHINNR
jgi:PAS domain S-box-containing protein